MHRLSMAPFQITTSLLGLALAFVIVWLIRRDELYVRNALFWLLVAVLATVMGFLPRSMDWLSMEMGVHYSPALILLCAVVVLFVKALLSDVTNTRLETDMRYLQQSMVLMEAELAVLRRQAAAADGPPGPGTPTQPQAGSTERPLA